MTTTAPPPTRIPSIVLPITKKSASLPCDVIAAVIIILIMLLFFVYGLPLPFLPITKKECISTIVIAAVIIILMCSCFCRSWSTDSL